jgi:tetratricopeptide (TPR) repeat protein/TolB-like protein
MATVFLAHDLKHDRAVALKVLRDEVAQSVGAERFLQEIRIVAQLQHPHVLTLLDSGEVGGTLYYVMPYIEGESLRDKLEREHELPVPDALRLLREVADALAFAHGKGVVHRDIKPDNVLLTGRHAVVADFGVSKALTAATGENKVTTLGVALGTPAYMAPEQAAADATIDHRADIYALGILGYELLTGRPPFTGSTPQQILGAQVTETPRSVTEIRPAVPETVSSVLMRCLEKRPADRWQTAEELRAQLEALQTPSGGIAPTTALPGRRRRAYLWGLAAAVVVALAGVFAVSRGGPAPEDAVPGKLVVIPLANRTGEAELDVWSENATSFFARALDRAGVIDVVPYSVVVEARQAVTEVGSAGVVALAEYVEATVAVSGQLYGSGEELRIDLELIDPATTEIIRTVETAVGPSQDPEVVVTAATERLVSAALAEFDPGGAAAFAEYGAPANPESFRYTLLGMAHQCRREYREAAVRTYGNLAGRGADARRAVRAAAALSGRQTRFERAMTEYLSAWLLDGDPEAVYRSGQQMALIYPDNQYGAAWGAMRTNRAEAAVRHVEASNLDLPCWRNWEPWWEVWSLSLHILGDYEEELRVARDARSRFPESLNILDLEIRGLIGLGRTAEADSLLEVAFAAPASRDSVARRAENAALEYNAHGMGEEASRAFARAVDLYRADAESDPNDLARTLYWAGEHDEAYRLLDSLVTVNPRSVGRLTFLGVAAYRSGRTEVAEDVDRRLDELDYPWGRGLLAAVRGDSAMAVRLLTEAIDEGFLRIGMRNAWMHRTPDLISLRGFAPFDRLAEPRR